jgi:hypothetical protein
VPSLDLRFADNKSLVDAVTGQSLVTFTRASSGTFTDSAGTLQTAATDVPRFHHNPTTGESLGLLVEEPRTNSITNNTMVGAVAGTPGTLPTGWPFQSAGGLGLSVSIVGTGTESGVAYLAWRISGTASAATSATISFGRASALTAQTWTTSSYLKLAAGSLSGVTGMTLDLIEETAASAFITGAAYSISLPTTNSLITQRPTASRTLTGGATVALIRTNLTVNVSSGSTVDFTLRIGLPQLELGAFPTSPIPTTTAAATRAADVASITGSAFSSWYRQDEGTVFAEGRSLSSLNRFAGFSSGSFSEAIVLGSVTTENAELTVRTPTTTTAVSINIGPAASANSLVKHAAAYRLNDFGVSNAGNIANTLSGAIPANRNQMVIGVMPNNFSFHNGTIRRLTFWGQRLANSTLQSITQ